MVDRITPGSQDLLLVIDIQNDFCPGGALAIEGGDDVVPLMNRLGAAFQHVVLTQDWHPAGHLSFASAHPGRKPFETATLPYGEQTLWPDHCVQGEHGAAFHPDLALPQAELIIRKGFRREIDSYSAFFENDRTTPTGLAGYMRERGFARVFIAGLALDFCVRFSIEDALASGFEAVLLEDACRAVAMPGSVDAAYRSFSERDVTISATTAIV